MEKLVLRNRRFFQTRSVLFAGKVYFIKNGLLKKTINQKNDIFKKLLYP